MENIKDLRSWISLLESKDELRRIKAEVNWDKELGAICRRVTSREGPALMFENIKGYKDGQFRSLFTNGLGARRRVALAMDMPKDTPNDQIVKRIKERLCDPIKPVVVDEGPVKENIVEGDEIDLYQLPVPKWHAKDGGRYIDTTACTITKDPDTGDLNIGTYRGMLVGRNMIGKLLATTQDWGKHFVKYRDRGEPMPVAIVYGGDPYMIMCSTTPIQHRRGTSEYDYAGGLRGSATELIKCESIDLLVPAHAEIVVEGYISPDPSTFKMEGPFGEYPGYYGGLANPKPTVVVQTMTYRNDAIFRGNEEGSSPGRLCESPYYVVPTMCAIAWNWLEEAGVPGVKDVWGHLVTSAPTNIRVRIKKTYRGHAKQVANALWGSNIGNYVAKHVVVVDEDIDIHSEEDMEWALAYRVNAGMNDVQVFHGCFGSMLDPSTPLASRNVPRFGQGKWSRVLVDATMDWELEPEDQFGGNIYPELCTVIPPHEEALIDKRWKEYGID